MTRIQWTHVFGPGSGVTWNPITGGTPVSEGCANCYAKRLHGMRHQAYMEGKDVPECYSTPFNVLRFHPGRLDKPLHWRKPRGVFVGSMTDLFHPDIPDEWLYETFARMALTPWLIYFVLTKRPERMLEWMTAQLTDALIEGTAQRIHAERTGEDPSMWLAVHLPLPNVWLGVTTENQARADERIPVLLDTSAAKRFVSVEPCLGAVNPFASCSRSKANCKNPPALLSWVICGGESGKGCRPMDLDWARSLRDQCKTAEVPFFFKQTGGVRHGSDMLDGRQHHEWPEVADNGIFRV